MASRISRKVCTLGRPGALGTGRWGSIQDHSASDKSVWYALLMLGTLPSHLLKAPFRTVSEGEFSEVSLQHPAYPRSHRVGEQPIDPVRHRQLSTTSCGGA